MSGNPHIRKESRVNKSSTVLGECNQRAMEVSTVGRPVLPRERSSISSDSLSPNLGNVNGWNMGITYSVPIKITASESSALIPCRHWYESSLSQHQVIAHRCWGPNLEIYRQSPSDIPSAKLFALCGLLNQSERDRYLHLFPNGGLRRPTPRPEEGVRLCSQLQLLDASECGNAESRSPVWKGGPICGGPTRRHCPARPLEQLERWYANGVG